MLFNNKSQSIYGMELHIKLIEATPVAPKISTNKNKNHGTPAGSKFVFENKL